MKKTPCHHVQLGHPANRTFHPVHEIDAHAIMWASAKGRRFIPAIARIGRKHFRNDPLLDVPLPDPMKFPVLHERIGYWETVIEIDDPEILLGTAVVCALNSFQAILADNPLAADPRMFVSTLTQAAREWAEECFNQPTQP